MATMNVSLPDPMKQWVEEQSASGKYANASDYIRDLIRRDQVRAENERCLREIVDNARASGVSEQTFKEIIADARARYPARKNDAV